MPRSADHRPADHSTVFYRAVQFFFQHFAGSTGGQQFMARQFSFIEYSPFDEVFLLLSCATNAMRLRAFMRRMRIIRKYMVLPEISFFN